jgi:hypothetical protein
MTWEEYLKAVTTEDIDDWESALKAFTKEGKKLGMPLNVIELLKKAAGDKDEESDEQSN